VIYSIDGIIATNELICIIRISCKASTFVNLLRYFRFFRKQTYLRAAPLYQLPQMKKKYITNL